MKNVAQLNTAKNILTIAIPTFNRANYLKNNLKNIIKQASIHNHVEVIVIDNASTDNTYNICIEYFKLDFLIIGLRKFRYVS